MIETSNKCDILRKGNEGKERSDFYETFLDMIKSNNKKAEHARTVRTSMTNRDDRLLSQAIVKQARKDFLNLRKFVLVEKDKKEKEKEREKEREKDANKGIERELQTAISKIDKIQLNRKDTDEKRDREKERGRGRGRGRGRERGRQKGKNDTKEEVNDKEKEKDVLDCTLGGDQSW